MVEDRIGVGFGAVFLLAVVGGACAEGEIGGGGPAVGFEREGGYGAPASPAALQCPEASPDLAARSGWRSSRGSLPAQSELRFDIKARPTAANLDGLVAVGAESIDDVDKGAIAVRFADDGFVDVRDGALYTSEMAFPYEPGIWYNIGIAADIDAQTYDVEIGPCGEPLETLVRGASFRDSDEFWDQLSNWAVWSSQSASLEVSTPAWITSEGCVPATCESLGQACGQPGDGCGGTLDCGGCPNAELCDGGLCVEELVTTPPPLTCVPDTCRGLSMECGVRSDGCGSYLACGDCENGSSCSSGVCLSAPPTPEGPLYYVDPNAGSDGDGSQSSPWVSLQRVIDEGRLSAGDTVWLMSGDYGDLKITWKDNAKPITIAAAPGQKPHFANIRVHGITGWTFRGLYLIKESAGWLFDINENSSSNIVIEDCVFGATEESTSGWNATDWETRTSSGITADGSNITIRNNVFQNVGWAISMQAGNSLIEGNLINWFTRDGIRALGDHNVYQYNVIKNAISYNDHHDDGIQSWSKDAQGNVGSGEVVGVVIRNNTIIETEDPNRPFLQRGLQGMGLFDGFYRDVVIENNVVIVDQSHGISIYGARNCKIVNNTVGSISGATPWIRINDHRGIPSQNNIVRNNLTTELNSQSAGVTEDHNMVWTANQLNTLFVDPANLDFTLRSSAPAIDAGTATGAPRVDRDLVPRPQGSGVDIGAHEH